MINNYIKYLVNNDHIAPANDIIAEAYSMYEPFKVEVCVYIAVYVLIFVAILYLQKNTLFVQG